MQFPHLFIYKDSLEGTGGINIYKMKTNRFFTAILAMALCVNFVSCGDDDDSNGGGSESGNATKRLTKVSVEAPAVEEINDATFQYDGEGRLSKMEVTYMDMGGSRTEPDTYSYSYNGTELTIVNSGKDPDILDDPYYENTYTYTLNDKGYVISGSMLNDDTYHRKYTFEYTDDYMTSGAEIYENYAGSNVSEKNKIIGDGLILPNDWNSVSYTDIPNKGNLFFHYASEPEIIDSFDFLELYFANLLGKAPKFLPKSAKNEDWTWNYSYELDDDGYPTTITINCDDFEKSTVITCAYEPVK